MPVKVDPEIAAAAAAVNALRMRLVQSNATRPRPPDWEPYWYQVPPDDFFLNEFYTETMEDGTIIFTDKDGVPTDIPTPKPWWCYMLVAGRGVGKTRTGSQLVIEHLRANPSARVGCGAPTIGDARTVMAEGESGLITKFRSEFPVWNRSLLEATHVGGGKVFFMGSENPERWNGPQFTMLWCDELALWVEESWKQAQFTLRLGDNPRCIVTTTPKNRLFVRNLSKQAGVVVFDGISTSENKFLSQRAVERLYATYKGTRLGRQELEGRWIDDVEGALWRQKWFDDNRIIDAALLPEIIQCVVAVDPNGSQNKDSADTGIAVVGRGINGHFYVWRAEGVQLSPLGWARRAIQHFYDNLADCIVAERNFGGNMVESTIHTIDQDVPLVTVVASRGKIPRAQPIASLYEQSRVHHIGVLTDVEGQMTSYPAVETKIDILDAVVWGITYLMDPESIPEDAGLFPGQPRNLGLLARNYPLTEGRVRQFTLASPMPGIKRQQHDPYEALKPR